MFNIKVMGSDKSERCSPKQRGFTLIEIMVVIVIFGILLAIAVPSYQQYIRKARRADAKTMLLDLAARQERYFSTNNSYTTVASNLGYSTLPINVPSSTQINYVVRVVSANATTFSLSATPNGVQATDPCGTFTLNQLGVQGLTGATLSVSECW